MVTIEQIAQQVRSQSSQMSEISRQLGEMSQSSKQEGFQSYQNPYNSASPGDVQAMEFRIGKKDLVDSVLRY